MELDSHALCDLTPLGAVGVASCHHFYILLPVRARI